MNSRPDSIWYLHAGFLLMVAPICVVGLVRDDGHTWQWIVTGMGCLVAGILYHVYLAWWRDRFELFFPGEPDHDTTRYQFFMDRCARSIAWRVGMRWERP